jgi:xanthine dehydrogenase YagR molybdenum-binding subunit
MSEEHLPTYMPTDTRPINRGQAVDNATSRLDAVAKVTGRAKYGRDVYPADSLFAAFVRCPYGAGTLRAYDQAAAEAVPGVVEVSIDGERGRFHGHTVGYVAADSPLALRRGMRALQPTWDMEDCDTEITDAGAPAPAMTDDARAALDGADHVLEAVYSTPVQTHSPLETHGAVVDHRGDEAIVYVSTQGTFAARDGLDEALGLPRAKYEVVCEYVGGGFGSKLNGAGKEGVTAARIAARHRRPVYLFVERDEDHLDTGNRPSSRAEVKIGFKRDGTIVGGQIHTWGGVGVGRGGGGLRFPSARYDLGALQRTHEDVQLNAGAPRPFRAPGCPQGAFVEELMLDEIAAIAGMDPLTLRMKLERSDDRRAMFEQGAEMIGWRERRPNGSGTGRIRRGFGLGSTSWGRFPSRAEAEVVINRDGSVEVRTGTQDIGTGQRTIMAIAAADTLGIPLRNVSVRIGRSSLPEGPASGGSVTAHNSVPAMTMAAEDARDTLLERIAEAMGIDASELAVAQGEILRNNEPVMTWADGCRRLGGDSIVGRGRWDRGALQRDTTSGHSEGVQFVELHVDTETGVIGVDRIVAIQACGKVMCRKTAESQIIGGVIQGVSYALFEHKLLDRNVGAMVNADFEWYKIAGTADIPHIEPVLWTRNQTGVRSLGEPPTIPTAGAIAGGVLNAIGAPVRDLPLTPRRVLAALEGGAA